MKTREEFIRKWLANSEKSYDQQGRDEMRSDLDSLLEPINPNRIDEKRLSNLYLGRTFKEAIEKYNSTLHEPLQPLPNSYLLSEEIYDLEWHTLTPQDCEKLADYLISRYGTPKRDWWMDLKEGDKFMYVGDVKDFFHFSLSCKNGMDYPVLNCAPYIEPQLTAESVIAKHNLSEQEVKAIREVK